MADWKQITARIRRARTSKDPAAQLANLYEKTRDAMVAFELARHFETSGQNADAAKWYSAAAERFRRADWKTKAQEAATRLGAEPAPDALDSASESLPPSEPAITVLEAGLPFEQDAAMFDNPGNANLPIGGQRNAIQENGVPRSASAAPDEEASVEPPAGKSAAEAGRRRRGRRGGGNRPKGGPPTGAPR